jgi:hypothetical protein
MRVRDFISTRVADTDFISAYVRYKFGVCVCGAAFISALTHDTHFGNKTIFSAMVLSESQSASR